MKLRYLIGGCILFGAGVFISGSQIWNNVNNNEVDHTTPATPTTPATRVVRKVTGWFTNIEGIETKVSGLDSKEVTVTDYGWTLGRYRIGDETYGLINNHIIYQGIGCQLQGFEEVHIFGEEYLRATDGEKKKFKEGEERYHDIVKELGLFECDG